MNDTNNSSLSGNLCFDPDVHDLGEGRSVTRLRIASNQSWKKKGTNDEYEERVLYINVVVWNWLAEIAAKFCKGNKVFARGELQCNKWTDDNNNERESYEIHVGGAPGSMIWLVDTSPFKRDNQGGGNQRSGGFGGGRGGRGGRSGGFGGGRSGGGQQQNQQRRDPPPAQAQGGGHDFEDENGDTPPF